MNLQKTISSKKYLFIDRDGVINKRIYGGYITCIADFDLLDDFLNSIKTFSNHFKRIFVVTNQQGVGKGLMSLDDLSKIHEFLLREVEKYGGKIDAVYFCPDLKDAQNNCRKPGLMMAEQAKADFPEVDFSESIMIGDTKSDLEFAKNANMMSVLLLTEHSTQQEIALADMCINSLIELTNLLK